MSLSISGTVSLCVLVMAGLAGCGGSSNNKAGGGGNPTTVTYTFTGAAPTAVATQIGTGSFAQASLQSGKLIVSIPNGTTNYSVAYLCPPITVDTPPVIQEYVSQASTLDGTSFTENCYNSAAPMEGLATLEVDASAIPGAGSVTIWGSGYPQDQLWSGSTLSFNGQMAAGTYDVFVVVYDGTGEVPLAVRILRSQTIPGALNGGNPVVFASSDDTSTQTITYKNLPAGFSPYDPPFVDFYTSGGVGMQLDGFPATIPATQYPAMPSGAVESGDYYTFYSSASGGASGGTLIVELATSTGGAQTITYPAPWTYSGPSAATLPTFNFDYSGFSGTSSVSQYAMIRWNLGTASVDSIQVLATENYQNGATSLAIPDLSGVTGFLAPAPSGTSVSWYSGIEQGSAFQTTPPNGTLQAVQNSGAYTEP